MQHDVKRRPIVEATVCLHQGFCSLYKHQLLLANGHRQQYYRAETKPLAALVVATTPQGEYVLVREYRHAVGCVVVGLPGGFVEKDELPLEAAQRELLEETGFAAEKIEQIGRSLPLPGLLTQEVHFFHAQAARLTQSPHLDVGESLETLLWTHEQLVHAIHEGAYVDSALCTGLFFLMTSFSVRKR